MKASSGKHILAVSHEPPCPSNSATVKRHHHQSPFFIDNRIMPSRLIVCMFAEWHRVRKCQHRLSPYTNEDIAQHDARRRHTSHHVVQLVDGAVEQECFTMVNTAAWFFMPLPYASAVRNRYAIYVRGCGIEGEKVRCFSSAKILAEARKSHRFVSVSHSDMPVTTTIEFSCLKDNSMKCRVRSRRPVMSGERGNEWKSFH